MAIGHVAERLPQLHAVIGRARLRQRREFAAAPVELAAIDDQPAHRVAVAAEEFRARVDDDVRAPFDRADEVGRGERVVDDQRHACLVRDGRDRLDVGDDAARIGDAFDEDRLRPVGDGALECLRIARIGPVHMPVELREALAELVDRAAIELARGDDLVAGSHQRVQGDELGCVARRDGEARASAFQRRDALLEHGVGRIHDPRIDVAEDLEIEQRRGVVGILEHEGRCLVDRRCTRAGRRIGLRARMHGKRIETVVCHGKSPGRS